MSQTVPEPHIQQINLASLSIPQLMRVKQQLEQKLSLFQESLQSLILAQNKLHDSSLCLKNVTPELEGKPILVPLTGLMCVPGRLVNTKRVIVDIGAGYYAEKDLNGAQECFQRKIALVTEQIEKILVVVREKSKMLDTVQEVIKLKVQSQAGQS